MSSLTILRSEVPEERDQWLAAWKSWPGREASAHPTYVELFADEGHQCRCAWLEADEGRVLFPFIVRPLKGEEWAEDDTSAVDLTNAYGYGGAFCWDVNDKAVLSERFWEEFDAWAHERGAVSLFARLTLAEEHRLEWPDGLVELMKNVVRPLDRPLDDIWMDYDHKVRKNVKTARDDYGLDVSIDTSGETLDEFLEVYLDTMDRVGADDWYYFPREFYERMISEMPDNFAFFHVKEDGEVIASELVIVSVDNIYSFLGGTHADAFDKRPNDYLKHKIVDWGIEHDKKAFVLGGGFDGEDGIFKYKRSFAPDGVVQYFVGNRVFDKDAYADLVSQRSEWEQSQGNQWEPKDDYFPAYRS
jgi:hypothetical protein